MSDVRTLTQAQLGALKWLRKNGGDGIFDKTGVLVAAGVRAGVMRSTWMWLEMAGLVERYNNKRRLRVTEAGNSVDISRAKVAADAVEKWDD